MNCRVVNAIITICLLIAGVKLHIVEPIRLQLENGVELDDSTYNDLNLEVSLRAVIFKPRYYQ